MPATEVFATAPRLLLSPAHVVEVNCQCSYYTSQTHTLSESLCAFIAVPLVPCSTAKSVVPVASVVNIVVAAVLSIAAVICRSN